MPDEKENGCRVSGSRMNRTEEEQMTFYEIITNGKQIEIDDDPAYPTEYESSIFWANNGEIWAKSKSLGTFPHSQLTPEEFNKHIDNMIREGFRITITENKQKRTKPLFKA
ncbi:MAG: hypothetical protein IKU30_04855 [Clostridia bacterium]|nr:hypothetical protein [Clostridia bacterium]